jgi:hypothetical protein
MTGAFARRSRPSNGSSGQTTPGHFAFIGRLMQMVIAFGSPRLLAAK